jgi:hypothetical protein
MGFNMIKMNPYLAALPTILCSRLNQTQKISMPCSRSVRQMGRRAGLRLCIIGPELVKTLSLEASAALRRLLVAFGVMSHVRGAGPPMPVTATRQCHFLTLKHALLTRDLFISFNIE